MGHTSRYKLWIPKFMAQNGRFVVTKKVLSRHGSYLWPPSLVVDYSFLSQHIFMLSSSILLQYNLTLSQHSYLDIVFFMSRHGFLLS